MRNAKSDRAVGHSSGPVRPPGAWGELDPALRGAWTGFLKAHAVLTRTLDNDLQSAHGLSLSEYDVLIQLRIAGRPLQMHVLADSVVLSRAGLTRCVTGLEQRGLVARTRGSRDVRQVFAELTSDGIRAVEESTATHLDGITRMFAARLTHSDYVDLSRVWRALLHDPPTVSPDHTPSN